MRTDVGLVFGVKLALGDPSCETGMPLAQSEICKHVHTHKGSESLEVRRKEAWREAMPLSPRVML